MVWTRLGVPFFWTPFLTVSQARTGSPPWLAKITLRALAAAFSFGVVDATAIFRSVALSTLFSLPAAVVWVTRSPPMTGRPS